MGRKDLLLDYDLQFFVMASTGTMAGMIDLNSVPHFCFLIMFGEFSYFCCFVCFHY